MGLSNTSTERIAIICVLLICGASMTSCAVAVFPMVWPHMVVADLSWMRYFVTHLTIWRLPLECYIALLSSGLLVARNSHWRIVVMTLLFAGSLGSLRSNLYNLSLIVTTLASITGLCASCASIKSNASDYVLGLIGDVTRIRRTPASIWKLSTTVLAVAFVITYLHGAVIRRTSEEADNARLLEWYHDAKGTSYSTERMTLEIFTDYQCPACSRLVPQYLQLSTAIRGDAMQITLKDYPLDSACNDLYPQRGALPHLAACSAAYAARLVSREKPNDVHAFRTWLYENRARLNDEFIVQKLRTMGVDNPQRMFDPGVQQAVYSDLNEAKKHGITAIPSVVLNGVLLPAGISSEKLKILLESEVNDDDSVQR